ncbi:Pleckstrin homology domain-containing protein [Cadophora sp. MPI-SDFR-AT-0126]|nr:Pleckstrin homology domain-containing protein [Leotiomycetes sp. MPI-SDFR-AT-0126]
MNLQPEDKQKWGSLFASHEEVLQSSYLPYISNQRKATVVARREFDKISQTDHGITADIHVLEMFLVRPFPRLIKYPCLLRDLRNRTEADEKSQADLTSGIEVLERVLGQANAAIELDLRNEAVENLCASVEDWKGLQLENFGELVLFGEYSVTRGGAGRKQYKVYLFERILLICKDVTAANKSGDQAPYGQGDATQSKNTNNDAIVVLRGRIFMKNLTEVERLVSEAIEGPREYRVNITYEAGKVPESLSLLFTNEAIMDKWYTAIDVLRRSSDRLEITPK